MNMVEHALIWASSWLYNNMWKRTEYDQKVRNLTNDTRKRQKREEKDNIRKCNTYMVKCAKDLTYILETPKQIDDKLLVHQSNVNPLCKVGEDVKPLCVRDDANPQVYSA